MSATTKPIVTVREGMVRLESPVVWECSLCWAKGGCQTRAAAELRGHAHAINVHPPCPKCDKPLDVNARCKAGCLDHLDLDPSPRRPTSRDRFGNRNR